MMVVIRCSRADYTGAGGGREPQGTREKLQLSEIRETLTEEHQVEEYFYCHKDGDRVLRGRITLLLPDFAENGNLHHFLVGFDVYQDRDRLIVNEKKATDTVL